MKKKILFVIPTLDLGGAEKSLVNLLNTMDYNLYDVDLFCFLKRGVFVDNVPKEVNFVSNSSVYRIFSQSVFKAVITFSTHGKWNLAWNRFLFAAKNRWIKNLAINEQRTWTHVEKFLPVLANHYDVAIGYLEKSACYFVVDKVKAYKKMGWIHTDLEALNLNFDFELNYFKHLDHIVTVSDGLTQRLVKKIPEIKNKTTTIENINSVKVVTECANQTLSIALDHEYFNIICVGRLVKEKGLFMAIDAVEILVEKGMKVKLNLIGKGYLEKQLKKYVAKKKLNHAVDFMGLQSNPYPLIQQADVFLMSSYYEGKSIALEEAKILAKPIVVTNFTSAKDQIIDNKVGLIAEMNSSAIAEKLLLLYSDSSLRLQLSQNLKKENLGNENEIEKLYQLIS